MKPSARLLLSGQNENSFNQENPQSSKCYEFLIFPFLQKHDGFPCTLQGNV